MDRQEQADGRKRVKERLIEPLLRLGLGLPSRATKATWPGMAEEIALRLAYMAPDRLDALVEMIAANPDGPRRDRIPSPTAVIALGKQVQDPPTEASALQCGVIGSTVGRRAIEEGWAPELLRYLKERHAWIRSEDAYAISKLKEIAEPNLRRKAKLGEALARGEMLSAADRTFLDERQEEMDHCRQIAGLAGEAA